MQENLLKNLISGEKAWSAAKKFPIYTRRRCSQAPRHPQRQLPSLQARPKAGPRATLRGSFRARPPSRAPEPGPDFIYAVFPILLMVFLQIRRRKNSDSASDIISAMT